MSGRARHRRNGSSPGETGTIGTSAQCITCRVPWADLLKKVFAVDVLACPSCGGRLQVIAFIAEALVAARILDHLRLDSCGPPLSRAQAPPELFDPGPSYDVPDSPYPA